VVDSRRPRVRLPTQYKTTKHARFSAAVVEASVPELNSMVYEIVSRRELEKSAFRNRVLAAGSVIPT
jgi:hypothetical protein